MLLIHWTNSQHFFKLCLIFIAFSMKFFILKNNLVLCSRAIFKILHCRKSSVTLNVYFSIKIYFRFCYTFKIWLYCYVILVYELYFLTTMQISFVSGKLFTMWAYNSRIRKHLLNYFPVKVRDAIWSSIIL